jgi:hypothetical protein
MFDAVITFERGKMMQTVEISPSAKHIYNLKILNKQHIKEAGRMKRKESLDD